MLTATIAMTYKSMDNTINAIDTTDNKPADSLIYRSNAPPAIGRMASTPRIVVAARTAIIMQLTL